MIALAAAGRIVSQSVGFSAFFLSRNGIDSFAGDRRQPASQHAAALDHEPKNRPRPAGFHVACPTGSCGKNPS